MGRRSHSRTLSIWANGQRVGTWTSPARGDMELRYDPSWVASSVGRPLSLSLPFTFGNQPLRGDAVANYFDNLLPDSEHIRKRVATRFKTGSLEPFDLLTAIGRDCVGAVQLMPEDEVATGYDRIDGTAVSARQIEAHLQATVAGPGFAAADESDDDFRLSLAGAQEKDAFLFWNGEWMQPRGATPSTHIFKLPMGLVGNQQADFTTSVDNEWLCLRLLRAYGYDAARADIRTFGAMRVLVVERFDRRLHPSGQWLLRLPQEDFCQVLGVSPFLKYESDGGPGLKQLFTTLQQSVNADRDREVLMASQVLFWLLRAPDGHAKNFSIHLLPGGRFQLTPLYDVMSAYPVMGDGPNRWSARKVKLAMALQGKSRHNEIHTVQRRHFNSTARKFGLGADAEAIIQQIIERTPAAIAEAQADLPADFSGRVADTVFTGLRQAVEALAAMPVEG